MPSPFPGMDPYIETCGLWDDFQPSLIAEIARRLEMRVPDRYVVRLGERFYEALLSAEECQTDRQSIARELSISMSIREGLAGRGKAFPFMATRPQTSDIQPVELRALVDVEYRESFVEILELKPKRRLVTTIEVLSPSNKRIETAGWTRYLRKRQAHLQGAANLVEIDLLRGGTRLPMEDTWPASPYYLLICRQRKAPVCDVWPAYFSLTLPTIPVPLAEPDPDVPLELQGMITAIYKRSRYELDIDYRQPCTPPLDPAGSKMIDEWLKNREPVEAK
jgi:hypothetical protein